MLSFKSSALEESFARQRNLQLVAQDEAWALFNLVFGLAGLMKYVTLARWPPLREAATIATWAAWSPLQLLLIRHRREWYVTNRLRFVMVMRVTRFLLLFHDVPTREDIWVGRPEALPSTLLGIYTHLCWKVNVLVLTAVGIILPMRLLLPTQLAFLLLALRATTLRCRQECGMPDGGLTAAALATACNSSTDGGGGGVGACSALGGMLTSGEVEHYYRTACNWIRRLSPRQLWPLPARWGEFRFSGSGRNPCLGACFAAHGWLQAVGGVLFPVLILWVWEERLRARHVCRCQQQERQRQGQPQEQRQLDPGDPGDRCVKPLNLLSLLTWFAASSWLLWLLMEALL